METGLVLAENFKARFPVNDFFILVNYVNFKFLVDRFPGVRGDSCDCWGDRLDYVSPDSAFVLVVAGNFVS